MRIIDIGCNLGSSRLYRNYQEICENAKKAGVIAQIITGSDTLSNEIALNLANQEDFLYATIGFHPHNADDWKPSLISQHLAALKNPRVVAVGELGLDYFRKLSKIANQKTCFSKQLELAEEIKKPLFLHEREAFDDFKRILTPYLKNLSGVWHCFTANYEQLKWALDKGLYIGITGWIADPVRGLELQKIVKEIPNDRLLIETDAPYLTPKTLKPLPKINEPKYLVEVLRVISQCRNQDIEELGELTFNNTKKLFRL